MPTSDGVGLHLCLTYATSRATLSFDTIVNSPILSFIVLCSPVFQLSSSLPPSQMFGWPLEIHLLCPSLHDNLNTHINAFRSTLIPQPLGAHANTPRTLTPLLLKILSKLYACIRGDESVLEGSIVFICGESRYTVKLPPAIH